MTTASRLLATILVASFGAGGAVAHAQDATQEGYGSTPVQIPQGGNLGDNAGDRAATPAARATPTTAASDAGTLPFTGLSLGLIVLAGGLLVCTGLALQRRSRNPTA